MAASMAPDHTTRNLARASGLRRSWAAEFALAQRSQDFGCAMANPHTWQRVELPPGEFLEIDAIPLMRDLATDAPRRPYRRRAEETKTTVHWGQRKLMLSELELLVEHGEGISLVVYAGAAPGTHLACLCRFFPHVEFEAFDPRPFDNILLPPHGPPNLSLHQEAFTDTHATELVGRGLPLLFVSDIRTADWQRDKPNDHDIRLLADLHAQRVWVYILRPRHALLKFRLPYTQGSTEYLAGQVRLPVWGPQTTTECRLLVSPAARKDDDIGGDLPTQAYDHTVFSEQMFYFNTVARISIYPRPAAASTINAVLLDAGLCCCFDCSREVQILSAYLQLCCPQVPHEGAGWVKAIATLSMEISRGCGRRADGLLAILPAPWDAAECMTPKRLRLEKTKVSGQHRKPRTCHHPG